MSFDFPFVRLFGVWQFCYYPNTQFTLIDGFVLFLNIAEILLTGFKTIINQSMLFSSGARSQTDGKFNLNIRY